MHPLICLGSLNWLPIVYGMWYAYEYCVTVTWRKFLSLCTFLNTGSLGPSSIVGNIPHLLHMECLFATLFVLGRKLRAVLVD